MTAGGVPLPRAVRLYLDIALMICWEFEMLNGQRLTPVRRIEPRTNAANIALSDLVETTKGWTRVASNALRARFLEKVQVSVLNSVQTVQRLNHTKPSLQRHTVGWAVPASRGAKGEGLMPSWHMITYNLQNTGFAGFLVPCCLIWVEMYSRGRPPVELAGQQVDHCLEVAD